MLPTEIIIAKRERQTLPPHHIETFINGYVQGTIADYQAAAFLMASFINGLDPTETAALTRAMMQSGDIYDLTPFNLGTTSDKHSTGGVGDKVSLILAPLVASCGVPVPMVSGRGLGHTGGTLDKLASIPGFDVNLTFNQFGQQLQRIQTAMIGQTDTFVPADKKLYSLRDVTGTIESIPLLCSSILSKKIASGTHTFVMDVKCGSGAFMETLPGARQLAHGLVNLGAQLGRPIHALITNMDQPLGHNIGNALEVLEAIQCLQNAGPPDLREITLQLSAEMLLLARRTPTHADAIALLEQSLANGQALQRFQQMIEAQHGNPRIIDNTDLLNISPHVTHYHAPRAGYINTINARQIGLAALVLGAGRRTKEDTIDPGVGFKILAKVGDPISANQPLVAIYHRNQHGLDDCLHRLNRAITITDTPPTPIPLIHEKITPQ